MHDEEHEGQTRVYGTREEAIDGEIREFLATSGEDSSHYDVGAIADLVIESCADVNGGYGYRVKEFQSDAMFGQIVREYVYEVVGYADGQAFTSSNTRAVNDYVAAYNAGLGVQWREDNGWSVEELDTVNSQASYERMIAPTDLQVAHLEIGAARLRRNEMIRSLVERGRSMYSIAKELGLSEPAINKIVNAEDTRGTLFQRYGTAMLSDEQRATVNAISDLVADAKVAYVLTDEERVRHEELIEELKAVDSSSPRYRDLTMENARIFNGAMERGDAQPLRDLEQQLDALLAEDDG